MDWRNLRQSDNVEDQRGLHPMVPIGGIGTLVLAVIIYFLGGNPAVVLNQNPAGSGSAPSTSIPSGNSGSSTSTGNTGSGQADSGKQFVAAVLGSTEDVWGKLFKQRGLTYHDPKLVLFSGAVRSACGVAGSSTGPFYCPNDDKVYLDLSFFKDLRDKYGASGDFAAAYVIAHEVGHHVQDELGVTDKVEKMESGESKTEVNKLSVRVELQADYYAGVWAHYANEKGIVQPGDIAEALNAASAVGDDRLEKETQGYVVPDSFTHGTSAQRVAWFKKGYESGDPSGGKTFSADLQ